MSPGLFSRQPVTPNKPPVCHKAPINPIPDGQPLWLRNATLVISWWGNASASFQYRSWILTLAPGPWAQAQQGGQTAHKIKVHVIIDHFVDPDRWGYGVRVWTEDQVFLDMDESNLTYQTVDPWDTGLQRVIPNLATEKCELQAMA